MKHWTDQVIPLFFSPPPYPLEPIIKLHSTPIRLPSLTEREIRLDLVTIMQYQQTFKRVL